MKGVQKSVLYRRDSLTQEPDSTIASQGMYETE